MNLLTFDIEDGLNLNLRQNFGLSINPTDRVVSNTRKILSLMEKHQVKGTFFILGEIAEFFPDLVLEIRDQGHEIGVHGYNHLLFTKNEPDTIYDEISRAKELIESITKEEVFGHRAPAFSITQQTPWAFDIIRRAGFKYDSSVVPATNLKYGLEGFPLEVTRVSTQFGDLIEVPISFIKWMGLTIPYLGGSYLIRSPKYLVENWLTDTKVKAQTDYLMLYLHPYEFDTDYRNFPEVYRSKVSIRYPKFYLKTLISRYNRSTLLAKIEMVIQNGASKGNQSVLEYLSQNGFWNDTNQRNM